MLPKFLFTLMLLGICLSQTSFTQPIENKITKNIVDELMDKAKESIEKLKTVIEDKIQKATDILEKIRQKVIEDGLYAIELVKRQLKYLIVKTSKAIEKIQKTGDEAGIDTTQCLRDSEDRLKKLFQEFYGNEIRCVEEKVEKVMNIIYDTIEIFSEAYQTVVILPTKLENCTNSVGCVTNILVEITQIEKDLPTKISKKVEAAQEFLTDFSSKLQACGNNELNNAGIKAAGIVSDVVTCAAEIEHDLAMRIHLDRNQVFLN